MGPAPAPAADQPRLASTDLDAKIVQLSKPGTTVEDVIHVLGEPEKYVWGDEKTGKEQVFEKDDLPGNYILWYPRGVHVWISSGAVRELRSEGGPGFSWRGKVHLGSSLDEVLQVVGPPTETVVGKPLDFSAGVLHKDIDGKKGYCYYSRPDQNVRMFFRNYKVGALYLTIGEGEDIVVAKADPNLDAKIVQLSKKGTTVEDVIRVLGEPQEYVWGDEKTGKLQTFEKNNLPAIYIARYPRGVQVMVRDGNVEELRSERPGPGFSWRGKVHLGSSLDEVLQVVGSPTETVVGKPLDFSAGVLYKDIDGKKGYCYYARPDQNVRCFFMNYRVVALYVTLDGGNH
jgi:hypothetical protein